MYENHKKILKYSIKKKYISPFLTQFNKYIKILIKLKLLHLFIFIIQV